MDNFDNTGGVVKRFLIVNRRAPHGTIYPQEALETVLIGAAFDQDVTVLFLDDGVFQLKKDQQPQELGIKNFSKTFSALEMYDVKKLVVEQESLTERGLSRSDLVLDVEIISREVVGSLMDHQDIVLSF